MQVEVLGKIDGFTVQLSCNLDECIRGSVWIFLQCSAGGIIARDVACIALGIG